MSQRPTKIKSELEERVHCCGINQALRISSSLPSTCRLFGHQISRGDGKDACDSGEAERVACVSSVPPRT